MTRPALRILFYSILFVTGLLVLGLMVGCSAAPVIINPAAPSKSVNTEPIRKALAVTKAKTKSADDHAQRANDAIRDAEAKLPERGVEIAPETLVAIHKDAEAARGEIQALRTDLSDAQASTASALEERAAVQEVADAEHLENVRLAAGLNSSISTVASLSSKVASAQARGTLYLKMLIGLGALDAIYLFLKFYLHIPFL